MKLAIIIPAFNEEKTIKNVLLSLPKRLPGIKEINSIVIDDGSTDQTFNQTRSISTFSLRHDLNLGVGAAISTGLKAALMLKSDIVVMIDADGQHDPSDIEKIIAPILEKEADIVIGRRNFKLKKMPLLKIIGNWGMNLMTFCLYHNWIKDSQSGMRAMNKRALMNIKLASSGYEFCSEMIGEAKKNQLIIQEVKIHTIYTRYSQKKGQNIFNFANILTRLLFLITQKKDDFTI